MEVVVRRHLGLQRGRIGALLGCIGRREQQSEVLHDGHLFGVASGTLRSTLYLSDERRCPNPTTVLSCCRTANTTRFAGPLRGGRVVFILRMRKSLRTML